MPRDKVLTFRPDEDIAAAMAVLWDRDGISYSEQIRRALRVWLEAKKVLEPKAARRRVSPRQQV